MLHARRAFLSLGHFAPCSDAINALVTSHLAASVPLLRSGDIEGVSILDMGCGEGYYLDRLRVHLRERLDQPIMCHGVDIAKDAARLAAKRSPELHVIVADVKARLPYADGAFHALLNIFAPRNPSEFARVLAPGGLLLVVIPTQQHLCELRDVAPLLNIEQDKQQRVVERLSERFAFAGATTLEYDIELSGADLTHLAQMTPSARHFSPQTLDGLREQTNLRTRVGFALLRFVHT